MRRDDAIAKIANECFLTGDVEVSDRIADAFSWKLALRHYPTMSAEEITSMAASTYGGWVSLAEVRAQLAGKGE